MVDSSLEWPLRVGEAVWILQCEKVEARSIVMFAAIVHSVERDAQRHTRVRVTRLHSNQGLHAAFTLYHDEKPTQLRLDDRHLCSPSFPIGKLEHQPFNNGVLYNLSGKMMDWFHRNGMEYSVPHTTMKGFKGVIPRFEQACYRKTPESMLFITRVMESLVHFEKAPLTRYRSKTTSHNIIW